MLPLKRSLSALALMAAIGLAADANAQHYRSDADAYPCSSRAPAPLTVVQDERGFSIRQANAHDPAKSSMKPSTDLAVAIGKALRVDRDIFAMTPRHEKGEADARR